MMLFPIVLFRSIIPPRFFCGWSNFLDMVFLRWCFFAHCSFVGVPGKCSWVGVLDFFVCLFSSDSCDGAPVFGAAVALF